MPRTEREFDVATRGTGKPDFSEKIHEIKKGKVYTEMWPTETERWKVFLNSFPTGSELGAGENAKLLDIETFLPSPYTSPAGYLVRFGEWMGSFDQACMLVVTLDTFPPFILFMPVQGDTHEYEQIAFFDTRYWDIKAEEAHTWDFTIYNTSGSDARGSIQTALVLEKIGSVEMKEKKVRCLKCGYVNVVPLKQTKVVCEKCGYSFFVPFYGGETV